MKFNDALVQLKGNVHVYRTGWVPQDGYLVLMPGMGHVWKILLSPAPNAGNYMWTLADFEAEDWEVFTHEKFTIEQEALSSAG